jgi:outer membrane protein
MSADAKRSVVALATLWAFACMAVVVAATALPARADGAFDTLAARWVDPLLTRPPVLDAASVLPGDEAAPTCPADGAEDGVLTLMLAVDLALCRNPQLRSTWAAIKVQAAALGEARAAWLPTATLGTSRIEDRTRYPASNQPPSALRNTTVNGTVNWRLFDFGGRAANQRSAAALLEAALADHDASLQRTLASVIAAYFDAQTAEASWQAKQQDEALARHTLETAQRRERRGAGAQTDTLQATTALAKASLDRSRAQGNCEKTRSVLAYALGVPAATSLHLAEDRIDPADDLRHDLNAWLACAQAHHPAIAAARAQLAAARKKTDVVRSDGLPTVDLAANYYGNGRPNQGLTPGNSRETIIGITLTVPLFEGFARTYKLAGAQAAVEQKEASLDDAEHQVLMEVVKAHADAMSALENLATSQTLLDAAQSAMDSVQRKFERGATDILEILGAQTALSDAQEERLRCRADWRSARLRLLANAGLLGLKDVEEAPAS